jgi:hypothetical protein
MNLDNLQQDNLARKSQNWNALMNNAMNLGIAGAELAGLENGGNLLSLLRGRKKPSQGIIDAYKARGIF